MSETTLNNQGAGGKPLTIVQILPHLGVGGAEQGAVDVAAAISRAGGKAIVISSGGHPNKLQDLKRAQATHMNAPVATKNPFKIWRNIGRLQKMFATIKPDIVHVRSRAPAWSAYYACKRLGIPFMTTCHAPYNARGRLKRRYNSIMSRGVRVIAISHFVADYIRSQFGIGDDVIRVVHRSVDISKFTPSRVTPDRLIRVTQKWRAPDGATIVLLPGRLTRWKGHTVLIEAIAELKNPDLFVVIQGSDQGRHKYTHELHRLVHRLGLEGQVRVIDHDDDVPAMYMASHIVVSASIEPEGFGRVAIEGLAMGRLVIATNHGGSRETIIDGETGWLVPPGDVSALARALGDIMAMSDKERAVISHRAIHHAREHFSTERMMEGTLAVYREIVSADKSGLAGA